MKLAIFYFNILLYIANAQCFEVAKCIGDDLTKPLNVNVIGCQEKICDISYQNLLSIEVNMETDAKMEKLKANLEVSCRESFSEHEFDVCDVLSNSMCPLDEGESVIFDVNVNLRDILENSPEGPVQFTLTVYDVSSDSPKALNCFSLTANVI